MKIIYVYENWSTQAPVLIGRLYVDVIKGITVFYLLRKFIFYLF